jgi:glycosyltransferase involved in cell wall biosynthesis
MSCNQDETIEVSLVMPCLNEADTLEICIRKAQSSFEQSGITGEIIVADNGSTDDSTDIANRLGARLIRVEAPGYGNALMGGIEAAFGRFVIMGDADDSYDFLETPKFVEKLRGGYDLVQGCRFPRGGGTVLPGAMPATHRWIGNPVLTWVARCWFRVPVNDIYCGMRGFTASLYQRLDQQCTGMEFATEMIIKSSLQGARITEVPITLHPDGRVSHPPHLKTLRDGWRTLRFFLMYSPRWLFLIPGMLLIVLGLFGYILALPAMQISSIIFDVHTLLYASLAILCGHQAILFAVFTKLFAMNERLLPPDPRFLRLFDVLTLERGLLLGMGLLVAGLSLLYVAFGIWEQTGFGRLNYPTTMRWAIPGATLTALGFQTTWGSFFASILGLHRK